MTALRLDSITLPGAFFLKGSEETQQQSYPVLFITALKLSKVLFGYSEYALRVFVLAASFLSLWLFFEVARLFLPGPWALLALTFFCISRDLIYSSIELKPAAFDILSVLVFTWMIAAGAPSAWSRKKLIGFAAAGFILVFLSIAGIIFMLSAVSCLMIYWYISKDRKSAGRLALILITLTLAAGMYYLFSLQYIREASSLRAYWSSSFFPLEDGPMVQYQWVVVAFKRLFGKFLQYPAFLSAALFVIGLGAVWLKDKAQFIVLSVPILAAVATSAIKAYPFDGRAIFFLVPFVIVALVHGIRVAVEHSAMKRAAAAILVTSMLLAPAYASAQQFLEHSGPEEIKPVLYYLEHHYQEGDAVFVYEGSSHAYSYYSKLYNFDAPPTVIGRKDFDAAWEEYFRDRQGTGRAWVIFTHVKFDARLNERLFILEKFKVRAQPVDALELRVRSASVIPTLENNITASVYLFQV